MESVHQRNAIDDLDAAEGGVECEVRDGGGPEIEIVSSREGLQRSPTSLNVHPTVERSARQNPGEWQSAEIEAGNVPLDLVGRTCTRAIDTAQVHSTQRALKIHIEPIGLAAAAGDRDRSGHRVREQVRIA